jgi:L-aminopeptidase/D-esterase-like protein
MSPNRNTLTSVPGIRVGHAVEPGGRSGCTVILGPFRGAVELGGPATGSRDLEILSPHHVSPTIEALVFSGGSTFGLAAADGATAWLEEQGQGFRVGETQIPLVPSGVIYDLQTNVPRPNAAMGRAACEAASDAPVAEGREGAGAGATAGKIGGVGTGMPAGLGSWSVPLGTWTVGAMAVVNPFGDVLDAWGGVLAGARDSEGVFVNTARALREAATGGGLDAGTIPGTNSTLAVVATDAPLSRVALGRVARVAATALARRISPASTPFDGDMVFVVSTADHPRGTGAAEVLAIGTAARDCLEVAIERSVHREDEGHTP